MWQVRAAGLLGGSSVAAGAYGAHGLKVSEEYKTIWRTAVQYHQFAAVSLLAAAAVPSARARLVSGAGICLGAAAFSGPGKRAAQGEPLATARSPRNIFGRRRRSRSRSSPFLFYRAPLRARA
mgnify:CR=1 FL=1